MIRLTFLLLISLLYIPSLTQTQCNTELPDNSIVILDSNTHHTVSGGINPVAFVGWNRFEVDSTIYPVSSGGNSLDDNLEWILPALNSGSCGPVYISCFQTALVPIATVDTDKEMNWLVSSYYENEANFVFIRINCEFLRYESDCRKTFQIFYYESDTSVTVTQSLLSQFLLADSTTNQLINDDIVVASFYKSKKGFYIGFLNQIPCASLTEFLFYYYPECPAISGVYSVSAVLPPSPADEYIRANVSCVLPFVTRYPLLLIADCYWNGTWRLPAENVCQCTSGSYFSTDSSSSNLSCVSCPVGTYKSAAGDAMEDCIVCPLRSSTSGLIGAVECVCDDRWYRGEGESVSESCVQSPSVVMNVRVERRTGVIELTVVWDTPTYSGTRDGNELLYRVSYYKSVSPGSEKEVELSERQFVLRDVSESTEYVIEVTSLNGVSTLSGVYNTVTITVLSSFPDLESIRYNMTTNILEWSYSLYGNREYVFELSYISTESNVTTSVYLNMSECMCAGGYTCVCSVFVADIDSTQPISFQLFSDNNSSVLTDTNLSYEYNFIDQSAPSSFLTQIIIIGVVLIVVILLIMFLVVLFFSISIVHRKRSVRSKNTPGNIPLMESLSTHTVQTDVDMFYQDPSLYEDLNKAIRSLTKEIDQKDIDVASVIGNGEFGDVCRGTLKINFRVVSVAIKTLKVSSSEKNKRDFFKEASSMGQFSHENVIYLYGVTLTKPIMIVTPFMENGSLDKFLVSNAETLNLLDLGKICLGVASGMNYLSKRGYVHRDLAARNVLIDSDYTPKIADFGLSRVTQENVYDVKTGGKIPVRWTAPEAILFRKFNMASDVWSYGILMWEVMSFGKPPYGDLDNYALLEQIQQGYRLEQPDGCPYLLYSLMLKCWDTIPEIRPTFSDLYFEVSSMVENNFNPRPKNRFSRSLAHSPLDFTSIEDWLTSLKMERYISNFKKNGYSNLSNVWHLSEHDLLALDIIPIGHRNKIMTSIHKANNKLSRTYSVRV